MAVEVKIPSPIGVNVTRTELFGIITSGELKPLWYRVSECLEDEDAVVWVVAFRPDNNPLTPCSLSSQAWNETTDKFGSYDIGTAGNNDDTFTAQGGGSGGGVESVTGDIVDNTDPANPVVTQVQADWTENDSGEPSFIKNREVIIIAVIVGPTPPVVTGDVEYEIPIKGDYDILDYSISAEDVPIGGITTIDLKKNGSLITTTGVNIASGSNDSTGTPTFSDNDVSNSKIRFTFAAIASYAGSKYTASIKLLKT